MRVDTEVVNLFPLHKIHWADGRGCVGSEEGIELWAGHLLPICLEFLVWMNVMYG